jgi:hypothetical protein
MPEVYRSGSKGSIAGALQDQQNLVYGPTFLVVRVHHFSGA